MAYQQFLIKFWFGIVILNLKVVNKDIIKYEHEIKNKFDDFNNYNNSKINEINIKLNYTNLKVDGYKANMQSQDHFLVGCFEFDL